MTDWSKIACNFLKAILSIPTIKNSKINGYLSKIFLSFLFYNFVKKLTWIRKKYQKLQNDIKKNYIKNYIEKKKKNFLIENNMKKKLQGKYTKSNKFS